MIWFFDAAGRWRSDIWKRWVASRPCICRQPECRTCQSGRWRPSEVALLRHPSIWNGVRPDDILSYPLEGDQLRRYQVDGPPPVELQWRWIIETWRQAHQLGVLVIAPRTGLMVTMSQAVERSWDWRIETTAQLWRRAFAAGRVALCLNGCRPGVNRRY